MRRPKIERRPIGVSKGRERRPNYVKIGLSVAGKIDRRIKTTSGTVCALAGITVLVGGR